jgi:hypothetical protein
MELTRRIVEEIRQREAGWAGIAKEMWPFVGRDILSLDALYLAAIEACVPRIARMVSDVPLPLHGSHLSGWHYGKRGRNGSGWGQMVESGASRYGVRKGNEAYGVLDEGGSGFGSLIRSDDGPN